ncbi:MAG: putative rane protein distantly related to colicin production protein [Ramlibacter sp.]|uniref:CvpA family protein n=1 Tax=Ramlibacter sp. TaxID=1917967 RepID=UPI00260960B8|nr:CvpA family protein [Ramlibacter sp.]MDB5749613.1 putative rane protein distantly related to colicin production protein [Ramlibacter sp.]
MSNLDWIVLAVLAASMLLGLWRGLVYEVLSVLSWIAAFLLAQWFAPAAAQMMPVGWAQALRYAAGFLLVFIAAVFAGGLLAWLTKKMVEAVGLRPVDRALGGLFGLVRGALVVLVLAVVVHLTGLKDGAWWTESMAAGVATAALRGLKPVVPETFGAYLPA